MNFTAKVTGKRFNLGDYKGLQVPCILQLTAGRKFVSILKEHFNLLKEKWKLSAANVRKKLANLLGAKPACFIKSSKNSSEVSSSHIAWKRGIILRLGLY